MSTRMFATALWRWIRDPRLALVVGGLLMAGAAIATAVTWPPSQATVRPFVVGLLLVLRGLVQSLLNELNNDDAMDAWRTVPT